jgi:hypothetical protein
MKMKMKLKMKVKVRNTRDSPPSLLIEHIDDALQLPLINLIRLIPLPLLQSLSNTKNNLQTSLHSSLGLVRDELDGVPKHLPSLGVADDDPRDLSVDELSGGDLPGESSVGGSVAVLGGDLDGGLDFFGGLEEVQGGRGDDDLYKRPLNCIVGISIVNRTCTLSVDSIVFPKTKY